jgi:hypothetical protein
MLQRVSLMICGNQQLLRHLAGRDEPLHTPGRSTTHNQEPCLGSTSAARRSPAASTIRTPIAAPNTPRSMLPLTNAPRCRTSP